MADLTPKQKLFIAEYLVDKNATQSAIRAGYSEKTANEQGSRLLANVSIQKEINKHIEKQVRRVLVNADKVINGILKIAETCSQEIVSDCSTEEEIKKEVLDPSNALRAYELLGKHLKLFTENIEVGLNDSRLSKLSTEEKVKLLSND